MSEKANITDGEFYFELIAKELNGEISKKEKSTLLEWVNKSVENRTLYEQMVKSWETMTVKNKIPDFNTEAAWEKLKTRAGGTKEGKLISINRSSFALKAAAAVLLLIGIFALVKYTLFNAPEAINFATRENEIEIYLPDSSKVLLNKNSTLTYYTDYDSEGRKVYLEGEAFFEVRKSQGKKFEVFGLRSITTVLGTSFSVRSVRNEPLEIVQVVTGMVSFADKNFKEKNEVILTPGFKGELDRASHLTKNEIKDPNFIAWRENRLSFDNASLKKVTETMEEYFGVEIEINDPLLLNCRFTGAFDKPAIEQVLEVLTVSTNSSYKKVADNKIILYGKGCSKK
jgi:transmembrane sensor